MLRNDGAAGRKGGLKSHGQDLQDYQDLGIKKEGGEMDIHLLTKKVIGISFEVHNQLGFGFLEKVYENALAMELRENRGLSVEQQHPIPVYYKNIVVGDYFADLLIEKELIVEIKSVSQLLKEHETQLVHYLTATKLDHGLLINFGSSVVVKHKYREYFGKSLKKKI
jgi:GxxExxY protein